MSSSGFLLSVISSISNVPPLSGNCITSSFGFCATPPLPTFSTKLSNAPTNRLLVFASSILSNLSTSCASFTLFSSSKLVPVKVPPVAFFSAWSLN